MKKILIFTISLLIFNFQLNAMEQQLSEEELVKTIYLQIIFPKDTPRNFNFFIEKIKIEKNLDLANAKPTFEQLDTMLKLITILQPNLEILNLYNCSLTKLPPILKSMNTLKEINLALNNLDCSAFDNLPLSYLKKITYSTPNLHAETILLPSALNNVDTIVLIPNPTMIYL